MEWISGLGWLTRVVTNTSVSDNFQFVLERAHKNTTGMRSPRKLIRSGIDLATGAQLRIRMDVYVSLLADLSDLLCERGAGAVDVGVGEMRAR